MKHNYDKLTDAAKRDFLVEAYENKGMSFAEIAVECGTYANRIRRDAQKLNIKIRDKSQAQKNVLSAGKAAHPTKGKQRTDETKKKIGKSVMDAWESLDDAAIENRRRKAKINWEKRSEDEKAAVLSAANAAVREASKNGSKLEKFLLTSLLEDGHVVEFHKEQSILNTRLQIDLFLPTLNIAIEVDGPSHFEPVWGMDTLARNKNYDNKKTGLIIGKGWYLIRVQQTSDFSNARAEVLARQVRNAIAAIDDGNHEQDKVIILGDR